MARGGSTSGHGGVRKKTRANNMGLQWWRKLTLPRRGKKDSMLQPQPITEAQKDRLETRRTALMKATAAPRVARSKAMAAADWDAQACMARVTATRGNAMQSMGVFKDGVQMLYPEEALFLVDRGGLDMCVDGLPASVQRAWAIAMSAENAVSLEEYLAFAHLRRAGYVVRRFGIEGEAEGEAEKSGLNVSFSAWRVGSFKRRDPMRPLFHVAVFRYEDRPPSCYQVAQFLESAGKSRLKFALIDRGVVVLKDVATNATPLSERFLRRLPADQQVQARNLEKGILGNFIGPPPECNEEGTSNRTKEKEDCDAKRIGNIDNLGRHNGRCT